MTDRSLPSARPLHVALLAVAALSLVVAATVIPGTAAHADPVLLQPGELVVNGDAEQAATVGWSGGLIVRPHGSGGYPPSVITSPTGLTGETFDGGASLFSGSGASSVSTQVIDLSPSAAAIDNGQVDALLSVLLGGYAEQEDRASLRYDFRDGSGGLVATVAFGPVTAADRASVSGFVAFEQAQRLPVGTRSVTITITTARFVAPVNDGYIDNVSLVLDAPSPVAAVDTAATTVDVPVNVDLSGNDVPGLGAVLVPTSVRLLDGGVEVLTLTTADGLYEVDPASGRVLFTPATGFVGVTAPVTYRVTDTSGQVGESSFTISVTVAPPVVPPAAPTGELATAGADVTLLLTVAGIVALGGLGLLLAARRRA